MDILFDHQIFTNQEFGGISRYFFELIKRFENDSTHNCDVGLKFTNNAYLNKNTYSGLSSFYPNTSIYKKQRIMNFLNKKICNTKLSRGSFDVFHPTYYDPYFLKLIGKKPFVITVLDMIHERFEDKYEALRGDTSIYQYKKEMIDNASKIIAISQTTKNDIIEIYGVEPSNIDVVYLGNSLVKNIHNTEIISEPYLLFVGNRGMYKNFELFVESIQVLLIQDDIRVICAGGGNFNETELNFLKDLGLEKYVKHYRIDSDITLSNLYSNAICFVFPSLYEGFGIPVLESFACGCPVVLSNRGSLPEVGGDAAEYFDPEDMTSIEVAISNVIQNEKLRSELRTKGYARLKQFSWDTTFSETLNVYSSLI